MSDQSSHFVLDTKGLLAILGGVVGLITTIWIAAAHYSTQAEVTRQMAMSVQSVSGKVDVMLEQQREQALAINSHALRLEELTRRLVNLERGQAHHKERP